MNNKALRRKSGFTLVELSVTVLIMAMVAAAVFSALAGGLNVYQRLRANVTSQSDVLVALEKLERDLRSSLPLAESGFQGNGGGIRFAGLLPKTSESGKQGMFPGSISYFFNPATRSLDRKTAHYVRGPDGLAESDPCVKSLADVGWVRFGFFLAGTEDKPPEWVKEIDDGGVPLGVRIELGYPLGRGSAEVERVVFLPAAR